MNIMGNQPVKTLQTGNIARGTVHAVDNGWEIYTGKNWLYSGCQNFQQQSATQIQNHDTVQSGIEYAREHEALPFYQEESRYRDIPAFELAFQDWRHEPVVAGAEIVPSVDSDKLQVQVSVVHPVTVKFCQVDIFDSETRELIFTGGARIISRTGTCYGLLIPGSLLDGKTNVNIKFTLETITEIKVSYLAENIGIPELILI